MALSDRIMTSGDVINDLHDRIIQDEQLIRQMRDALESCNNSDGYNGPYQYHDDKAVESAIAAANARLEQT